MLSPYLFRFYVLNVIQKVIQMKVGCNVRGTLINLLCFADDIVILAPSWSASQSLTDVPLTSSDRINMKFNANTTVCMVFNPTVSRKIVAHNFPQFTAGNDELKCVDRFKYLGSRYNKCVKRFFGYAKYSSMSDVFLQTGLPTGDNILFSCKFRFSEDLFSTCNKLAKWLSNFVCISCSVRLQLTVCVCM